MPIKHSTLLNTDLFWTNEEIAAGKRYLKWEEVTLKWENVDLKWEEVFILLEVEKILRGGGGSSYKEYVDGNPWKQLRKDIGDEKTDTVIKIYCRVRGIDYEEIKEKRDDIKVSVNDFDRFIKDQIKIKIDF